MRLQHFLGLVGLAVSASAAAQTTAQRVSLVQFRADIEALDDSVRLVDLEASMIDLARVDRDNALLHVKLGFLAYRLGEVTGSNSHFDDAGGEFEWATELEPTWPYPWYGLGLAELAIGESSVIAFENIRQFLGRDYLSKATAAFAQATVVEPSFTQAVVDLAETAMRQKIRPRTEVALRAVREAAQTGAADVPEVQLARGRLERILGDGDSAMAALTRFLEVGGDPGIGQFEMARALYYVGQRENGERAYYLGAAQSGSEPATALYREDFGWAASPEELAAFDAVPSVDREEWLRDFWRRRDMGDVRVPGERLAEHYRRYFYAVDRYSLVSRHRRYDVINPYRNEQQVFDDRGIIYIRHGEPDQRAFHTSSESIQPNESWAYVRPGRNLIFHFAASDDVQDYKLVESLSDILGAGVGLRLEAGGERSEEAAALFASRSTIDPIYQRLASFPTSASARLYGEERRAGARAIRIGTTTDGFPLRYAAALGGVVRRYLVGDARGDGWQVLLVFAVPGSSLVPDRSGDGLVYRVGARVVVTDTAGEAVLYVDSTSVLRRTQPLGEREFMTGFLAIPVPKGDHRLRLALDQGRDRAGELLEDTVQVPDPDAKQLAMSDVLVGHAGSGLAWVSVNDTVPVSPTARFSASRPLEVYYEIHGMERGAPYRSRLEVRKEGGGSIFGFFKRLFGGGGPPVALTVEGVASGPVTRILQTVDVSRLKPGRYRVRVSIQETQGDGRVERETALEVEGT
jgi:hypothetical protein